MKVWKPLTAVAAWTATVVGIAQGWEMLGGDRQSISQVMVMIAAVVTVGILVFWWGYLHLVKTGVTAFASEFTSDERAWDKAKRSLVYLGVTGFSITERFIAWCEKNRSCLPAEMIFLLVHPDDKESLCLVASHRLGRRATEVEVERLRQEILVSLGKLKASWVGEKLAIKFYRVDESFIPVWAYLLNGEELYVGFTPPGGTGMNSPAYACRRRRSWYGIFDAYQSLIFKLLSQDATGDEQTVVVSTLVQQLAIRVVTTLRERGEFITTVESCTGGGLANAITNISGASEVLKGARVTYSNEEKMALGVPVEIVDRFSVYSAETAEAMAEAGSRAAVRADIAVGITGSISRVDPANPNSQPGVVYIAVKRGDKTISRKFTFSDQGERWEVKERAIAEALAMVLEILS